MKLFYCIKTLGLKNGFKYWYLGLRCAQNPQLILDWANNCDKESNLHFLRGEKEESEAFSNWAKELRRSYNSWTRNNFYFVAEDGEVIPDIENMTAFLLMEMVLFLGEATYLEDQKSVDIATLTVLCSDHFYPGADSEPISYREIPKLYELFRLKNWDGVYEFVAEKRNIKNEHWNQK